MTEWFESLQPRERLFVTSGAIVVATAILWGLVWAPLDKSHETLRASVQTWERSLAELKLLVAVAESGGATPATNVSSQTPVVIVDQTLGARGLNSTVTRRQPTPNGIRVEFENVAFDDLVLWLGDLSSAHALEVQAGNLSVADRASPGRINASITLERTL